MDLDAVTMRPQPRTSFVAGCDWAQTTEDVTLFVALPADARARDLKVQIDATELRASLRDGRPLLDGALGGECDPGEACVHVPSEGFPAIPLAHAIRLITRPYLDPATATSPDPGELVLPHWVHVR